MNKNRSHRNSRQNIENAEILDLRGFSAGFLAPSRRFERPAYRLGVGHTG